MTTPPLAEQIARIVKGARLSAAFGREFRPGDGRLDDVDLDAAADILSLPALAEALERAFNIGYGAGVGMEDRKKALAAALASLRETKP